MKKNDTRQDVTVPEAGESSSGVSRQKSVADETRQYLAYIFVIGYLVIIAGVILLSYSTGFKVDDLKDLLLAVSGVLSGPLGFIIGYYFKATEN